MSSDRSGLMGDAVDTTMSCAFCRGSEISDDMFRRTVKFQSRVCRYSRCRGCGSRSLSPMPDNKELRKLYTKEYFRETDTDQQDCHPPNHKWVLNNLPHAGDGLFVDLGCGDGELLRLAAERGYDALGFDVDEASVEAAKIASGCMIRTFSELSLFAGQASAVHFGDVLEHVADPESLVREAILLLRPGGLVLAQGPLEANRSLFNILLAVAAICRRSVPVTTPPYHVHLVSSRGQEGLFQRLGLETLKYRLSDVNWPAPSEFRFRLIRDPRRLALYLCRRISSAVRPLAPQVLSNRFEYIGRHTIRE
jgi:2-polyprenyl-3-methyl-5-hydroxy-6-metoxy-1,4-benzoquinol methylase